jgi:hypothetical protein
METLTIPLVDEITRQQIERITIVGKMEDSKRVMEYLYQAGYRVIRSGPYTDREMFPQVDIERFKFVAEREI